MYKRDPNKPDAFHRNDSKVVRDDTKDLREANENIRKSQGENSGADKSFQHKPSIDRDR